MGYPNPPQIPLPSEVTFRGICVYVPNEPEYVRALLGSLVGLSQWVNWKRDANQSASKSANLWKLANNLTLETWENDCAMNCEDIIDRITEIIREELENVQIINTNNLCCGCCGGAGSTQTDEPLPPGIDYPPMPTIPPEDDEPPVDPTVTPGYVQYSCNMAHYMFYLIRQSILAGGTAAASSLTFRFQLIKEALGFSVRPGGADEAALSYWEYAALSLPLDQQEYLDTVRQLDAQYDQFICALSSTNVASERRSNFLNALALIPITERQLRNARFFMSGIEFHSWFNATNYETVQATLPPSYTDRVCPCQDSNDEGPIAMPDAPGGFKFVPMGAQGVGILNNTVTALGDGRFTWSLGDANTKELQLNYGTDSESSTTSCHGWLIQAEMSPMTFPNTFDAYTFGLLPDEGAIVVNEGESTFFARYNAVVLNLPETCSYWNVTSTNRGAVRYVPDIGITQIRVFCLVRDAYLYSEFIQ